MYVKSRRAVNNVVLTLEMRTPGVMDSLSFIHYGSYIYYKYNTSYAYAYTGTGIHSNRKQNKTI